MAPSKTQNIQLRRTSRNLESNYFNKNISKLKIDKTRDESDVKIKETESSFHYELKLPGYVKEDFNFYINKNDNLVVTTEKINKKVALEDEVTNTKHSYCYASAYFKRNFKLPKNVVRDEISVDYKDEILSFDLFKTNNKVLKIPNERFL
ncbi:Hsp20/alpha crystallin family protein [Flaviramulus basaltis]|uniref:Hsp20/alpha crystallin family protein n=1 Tax=Flaviramulus basaltis TaxID=369401 RepID=A0A1K2IPV6_9FLAO|nr:Hsp20/alpha crystallin family protein [Flaviramulus basaltis]SFZ94476.1 Hsp20/alpha crystallin family protein [Flaviramulus basaltis]